MQNLSPTQIACTNI